MVIRQRTSASQEDDYHDNDHDDYNDDDYHDAATDNDDHYYDHNHDDYHDTVTCHHVRFDRSSTEKSADPGPDCRTMLSLTTNLSLSMTSTIVVNGTMTFVLPAHRQETWQSLTLNFCRSTTVVPLASVTAGNVTASAPVVPSSDYQGGNLDRISQLVLSLGGLVGAAAQVAAAGEQ